MSKELATIETSMKAITFTSDEIAFIREKYAPNATDLEWREFIALAQMHGANPMKKQIYFIKYGEGEKARATIVFDYKFKIAKAEATGVYGGFTETTWYDEDGKEYKIWPFDPKVKAPFACRVGIRRKDWTEPMYVSLYLHERIKLWNGKPMAEWGNQPMHMLEKCTKSKALDQAITETAGMLIREEVSEPIPDGEWQPPATFQEAADSARTRSEATKRLRTGDLRPADDLPVDARDKNDLKLMFKDLGLDGSEAIHSWWNEVLKANDMPTVKAMADLTKGQAAILLDAGREELKSKVEIENAAEGSEPA